MNYAVKAGHLNRPLGYGRSLQLLTANDAGRLEVFYLSLDFDNRRGRFGGGQSDESIVAYCRTINWQSAIIIARVVLTSWTLSWKFIPYPKTGIAPK
jgi:hypothetical protein